MSERIPTQTTEQISCEKKWVLDDFGAIDVHHITSDRTVRAAVDIHVGNKFISVRADVLGQFIEILTAAKEWLEERGK